MIPTRTAHRSVGPDARRGEAEHAGGDLLGAEVAAKQHCGWQLGNTAALKHYTKAVPTSKALRTGYTGDNMIPFNAPPPVVGTELEYMRSAMSSGKLCGDGGTRVVASGWATFRQREGVADAFLYRIAGDGARPVVEYSARR